MKLKSLLAGATALVMACLPAVGHAETNVIRITQQHRTTFVQYWRRDRGTSCGRSSQGIDIPMRRPLGENICMHRRLGICSTSIGIGVHGGVGITSTAHEMCGMRCTRMWVRNTRTRTATSRWKPWIGCRGGRVRDTSVVGGSLTVDGASTRTRARPSVSSGCNPHAVQGKRRRLGYRRRLATRNFHWGRREEICTCPPTRRPNAVSTPTATSTMSCHCSHRRW